MTTGLYDNEGWGKEDTVVAPTLGWGNVWCIKNQTNYSSKTLLSLVWFLMHQTLSETNKIQVEKAKVDLVPISQLFNIEENSVELKNKNTKVWNQKDKYFFVLPKTSYEIIPTTLLPICGLKGRPRTAWKWGLLRKNQDENPRTAFITPFSCQK